MLLNRAAAAPEEWSWEPAQPASPPAPPSEALLEYDARRCHLCQARWPAFGFAPPLCVGTTIWACGEHRNQVDRALRGIAADAPTAAHQPRLL